MKNQMDSRNRSAFDIVADLRALGAKKCRLAVLGSANIDHKETAAALSTEWNNITHEMLRFEPQRLVTSCYGAGAEKAARLMAKEVTGKLAVVFHRATMTYGRKAADEMMASLVAQEADALLVLHRPRQKVCVFARSMFVARNKPVYEIEVG